MWRIYIASRPKGIKVKGSMQSNVRFGPVSDMKIYKKHGRYDVEVEVQFLFQDQTTSWIRIVNCVDNFVREVMPIEEEEKASEKPAAKARPIHKLSSMSGWDFIPDEQRQWIDIGIQESNDPRCFQVSKFITRLLRHNQKVCREADGAVHYDQIIDECKKKSSEDPGHSSDEMKKQFVLGYQF